MQLISVMYHRYINYRTPYKISVKILVLILSAILTDISPIFPISVPFFLVIPFVFLLIAAISVLSLNCYSYLLQLSVFCKLQKVTLLMVGEYTGLLVLNCYIYKSIIILKLPISHCDDLYLKYRSLTDIRYFIFTALIE
ncbi:hypothetical protein Hanom_Chr02g00108081 [Helianthus anomalus]